MPGTEPETEIQGIQTTDGNSLSLTANYLKNFIITSHLISTSQTAITSVPCQSVDGQFVSVCFLHDRQKSALVLQKADL